MMPSADQPQLVTPYHNRATRRRSGWVGKGLNKPIDLGIKQYKREHGNEPKRVLYYKQEMWKAFRELRSKDGKEEN